MWQHRLFLLLCAFSFLLPLAHAQSSVRTLTYTTDAAGVQRGDLYQPAGDGPFPALVYVHGGSWRSGNKKNFRRFATDVAAAGYVGFSIDYDLKPHSYPLSWQETRAAIRFLRLHAREYHVDPDRIAVVGTSAGGELAALAALAPQGPASPVGTAPGEEAGPVPVAAGVILNGAFDLSPRYHVISRYLGGNCPDIPEVCREASPLHHIHAGEVPLFVGHGDNDHVVSYAAALAFIDALRLLGQPVTPFVAAGGPHMYWTKPAYYKANLKAVEQFLQSTLQAPASAAP